ncbi:MAG: terminase family protein [Clostridiales bacterium]|nr:terminase family protein [Clostridiales bacterium]MDY6116975.1 terminase family protein [Anaerovoracaceae bacterium]
MAIIKRKTIPFNFSQKHKDYIKRSANCMYNIAEGAIRAGKTVDNVFAFAYELKTTKDKLHLATGSTVANAKLNIGDANGFGLEYIFRGQCRWGKYKDNDALFVRGPSTRGKQRIIIFAGGAKADSFKKIRGNSYGMWIATEINLHHDNTIKEAFNRTAAASKRKFFWDLNPDNPNAEIYTEYIDKYERNAKSGKLLGGYNYQHFTIDDNINISEQRRAEIKSQYDATSIWYKRDILGQRCIAEGLIYRIFAENYKMYAWTDALPRNLNIIIGVDFGGNNSAHSFTATGITPDFKNVIVLTSERISCRKDDGSDIDPDQLGLLFCDFCKRVINVCGNISRVYCDSAEQVLIAGLRTAARKQGLSWLSIQNSLKDEINNRINLTVQLMAQGRFFYIPDKAESLKNALRTAIWDPKEKTKNVRLDDGSSDIDSLDSFEYTIEREARRLINY